MLKKEVVYLYNEIRLNEYKKEVDTVNIYNENENDLDKQANQFLQSVDYLTNKEKEAVDNENEYDNEPTASPCNEVIDFNIIRETEATASLLLNRIVKFKLEKQANGTITRQAQYANGNQQVISTEQIERFLNNDNDKRAEQDEVYYGNLDTQGRTPQEARQEYLDILDTTEQEQTENTLKQLRKEYIELDKDSDKIKLLNSERMKNTVDDIYYKHYYVNKQGKIDYIVKLK
jgi:hypothetical protein